MALSPGTRLGHYNVTALLGEGGMGQVWQATDTQLGREGALKILPDAFAADPDRLARFKREAQILASLNHPNIAAIYGIEEAEGTRALVLELVEGPTLADRISKGPIPLDEALPIAKQIAEALEAAHEAGVIHRDLKPANIKVREDGTVKVLDFGLAKALDPLQEGDPSNSPTLTAAATQMGVVIGTAAYMSPEQARGAVADRRADIWAFGVVLYETVTGRRLFEGATVSDTLASVLKTEPDWSALPSDTPSAIRRLLRRSLDKDRKERLQHIGDVRVELREAVTAPLTERVEAEPAAPHAVGWRRALPWAAGIVIGSLITGIVLWNLTRPAAPRMNQFTISSPTDPVLFSDALSPDGRTIAFANDFGDGSDQVYIRRLDELDTVPLRGAEGTTPLGFSPDSDWLLVSYGAVLKRVPLAGGQAITIADDPFRVADWGPGDIIVSGSVDGLWTGSASGGDLSQLIAPAEGEPGQYFGLS